MPAFLVRENLSRGNLGLFLNNQSGYAQDAFSVRWTIHAANGTQVSGKSLPAIRARVGEYYAPWCTDVKNGSYRITWEIVESSGDLVEQVSENLFIINESNYIPCLPPTGCAIPTPGFSTFLTGSFLGIKDLPLYLRDSDGFLQDAYVVFWTILDEFNRPVSPKTIALNASIGEYYVSWPVMVKSGNYVVLWEFQQDMNSPMQSVKMRFSVIYPANPFVALLVEQCPGQPFLCSSAVPSFVKSIVVNNCAPCFPPLPPPPPNPVPPVDPCCGFEVARTVHFPAGSLPASGNFTNQLYYVIPQRIRHVTFYIRYTRGAPNGYASLRLIWGNGIEETQETSVNVGGAAFGISTLQSLSLQELEGPSPTDNNPVNFMVEAGIPGGATTVRLVAAEAGVPGSPGIIGITLTASST